eukprot:TRINITY_DN1812_c0_g1_i3.p1 TRINITY_DN1812_c0_g1~~TRINITY_DN1812_c0_g1_i3.p1  ORF type:complete len:321 (-),score=52.69 TRINITY_DN1812_c0_g1_i3:886-1824(-)
MCIRDRYQRRVHGENQKKRKKRINKNKINLQQKYMADLHFIISIIVLSVLLCSGFSIRFSVNLESGKPVIYTSAHKNNLLSVYEPAIMNYINESQHISHFATLQIITNPNYNDTDQAYYAGYLEGYGTAEGLYNLYVNEICLFNCSGTPPQNLTDFLNEQENWVKAQIQNNTNDSFWQYIQALSYQFQGIMDGYTNSDFGKEHPLNKFQFQFITELPDMSDVYDSLMPQLRPNYSKMKTIEEVLEALVENDHCTAVIKITDDYQDILIGHSTWDTYANMNRVFKQYEFNFNNPLVRAKKNTVQLLSRSYNFR